MSMVFRMTFIDIEENLDLLVFLQGIMKECKIKREEILSENRWDIPSVRKEQKWIGSEDCFWLYPLFTYSFTFWKEYHILGICGCLPESFQKKYNTVLFDDRFEPDYPLSTWEKNQYLKEITDPFRTMSDTEIEERLKKEGIYEKGTDVDFNRNLLAYHKVSKSLHLDSWICGKEDETFERFSMCAISSTKEWSETMGMLRKIKKELREEEENEL